MTPEFVEAKTTCGNKAEALLIAKKAVENGICACSHINEINSFYNWDNKITADTEFVIVFKLAKSSLKSLYELIKSEHSYELPSFYAIPVIHSSNEYKEWVNLHSLHYE